MYTTCVMCACDVCVCSGVDFLGLLVKLVHYNSAYLDEEALSELVSLTCSLATQTEYTTETEVREVHVVWGKVSVVSGGPEVTREPVEGGKKTYTHCFTPSPLQLCLEFLDAVVCYSSFPASTIHATIITLCHTLNIERFIQRSLEVGS